MRAVSFLVNLSEVVARAEAQPSNPNAGMNTARAIFDATYVIGTLCALAGAAQGAGAPAD